MMPKHKSPEDFFKKAHEKGSEKNKDEGVLCRDEEGCSTWFKRDLLHHSIIAGRASIEETIIFLLHHEICQSPAKINFD
jgi:hypothetical protein